MGIFKPCPVCGRSSDAQINAFCSQECGAVQFETERMGEEILAYNSEDKRIFFYDFAFGDLCDLWTTYLLRRVHTKDLTKARAVDRALERLEKAILTKLNKLVEMPKCETRKLVGKLLQQLLAANAGIWNWKNIYCSDVYCDGDMFTSDEWAHYLDLYKRRDGCRQQLDKLVEQHTMTEKTY